MSVPYRHQFIQQICIINILNYVIVYKQNLTFKLLEWYLNFSAGVMKNVSII